MTGLLRVASGTNALVHCHASLRWVASSKCSSRGPRAWPVAWYRTTTRRSAAEPVPGTRRVTLATEARALIEDIEEQYATAQDEYEIALAETENKTVYAADDRAAAKEQVEQTLRNYITVVKGNNREASEKLSQSLYEKIKRLVEDMEKLEAMAAKQD